MERERGEREINTEIEERDSKIDGRYRGER